MRFLKSLFLLGALLGSTAVLADAAADIRQSLQRVLPGMTPDTIAETPINGLYEVTFGPRIFYVSKDGRYLMQGSIMDTSSMNNITADRQGELVNAALDKIGDDKMIHFDAENPKHTVTVFTDIDCGYCRKLHSEIDKINALGISVRYLFFPRAGKDTPSYYKAETVWCSDDRAQALTDAKNGKKMEQETCDNPIDEHMALVQAIGLNGTPAIVMESGQIVPGYMPAEKLAAALDQQAARR